MANGPFILTEQQVALRLGVPTPWVSSRRGPRGQRWDKTDGGRLLWSESGAAELVLTLEESSESPPAKMAQDASEPASAVVTIPGAEKCASAPAALAVAENLAPSDHPIRLLVRRTGWKNRRVLHAVVVGAESDLVTVWVQNSGKFAVGLEILGRPWPGRPGVFTFAGNPARPEAGPREPRRKGGW